MTSFVPTVCPYCAVGCGMLLVVQDGVVIGVRPMPGHPTSIGQLCVKGWNAHQFVHHPDRLRKPVIRQNGALRESTWDESLQLIADRLTEIISKSGPSSVAVISSAKCTNEENYLAQKLARTVFGSNNIDHCARLCHASTITGLGAAFGSGAMTNSIADIELAKCILVIGSNTTEQHPVLVNRMIVAKESGAKIIVADPRRIHLCDLADVYLPMRPGTDVALLNGLASAILYLGLQDEQFISARTEGFGALAGALKGFSLARTAEVTGVAESDIAEAARLYARSKPATIVYSMGITQHTTGTDNVHAIANLAMLTGNVGKPGSGVNPLRGHNNVQGACDMGCLPDVFPGYQAVAQAEARSKIASAWGVPELTEAAGLTSMEMIRAAAEGHLRAIYTIGENPVLSHPDIEEVKKALQKLDFLVVQDIFPTETSKLAHVVLPGACWAEKDGTFTNTERRVQRVRKAVEPPGEARADWQIICDLARLLGCEKLFRLASPQEIFDEMRRVNGLYGGMTYAGIETPIGIQWPCPTDGHAGTAVLHVEKFARGKGQFHSVAYREAAEVPDEDYPYTLTTGRVMPQWHTGTMTRRSASLEAECPEAFIEINPLDAQVLGAANGTVVEVCSRRGRLQTVAVVTTRIRRGVVFMPFHYAESAANVLTNTALDPLAKIPELKVCAVRISILAEEKGT